MRTCEVLGCERKHAAHGLCLMHYKRRAKTGTTDPAPSRRTFCRICGAPNVARQLCGRHYAQWQAHGDPLYTEKLRASQEPIVVNRWGYLQRRGKKTIANGHQLIHREIAGAKPGEHVHHINGDKLDNRRENLWVHPDGGAHMDAHASLESAAFEAVRSGLIVFSEGTYSLSRESASTAC